MEGGGGGGGGGGGVPKRKGLGKKNVAWVIGCVNEKQNNSKVGWWRFIVISKASFTQILKTKKQYQQSMSIQYVNQSESGSFSDLSGGK
jgi:hypothetical protein